jgi:hypothetical protein
VAGFAPKAAQPLSEIVVPSDCKQVTLRVSVALVEQLDDGALQSPIDQLIVQALKSLKSSESAASLPQEAPLVAVQLWLVSGAVPVQEVFATVAPSERRQVML